MAWNEHEVNIETIGLYHHCHQSTTSKLLRQGRAILVAIITTENDFMFGDSNTGGVCEVALHNCYNPHILALHNNQHYPGMLSIAVEYAEAPKLPRRVDIRLRRLLLRERHNGPATPETRADHAPCEPV